MFKLQKIVLTVFGTVLAVALVGMVATRVTRPQAADAQPSGRRGDVRQREFAPLFAVPDFKLADQNGNSFGLADLRGKVWIADFIFTRCAGPCPVMSSKMAAVQSLLKHPDVRLVSFTVDPDRDTPSVLKDYGKRYGADDSRWSFLTGPADQMRNVARGMNIAAKLEDDESVTHSTHFLLVDREGNVCGIYGNSDEEVAPTLAADATELAKRPANGKQ
jgi:protein SCO1/2